jgi:C1A family cysteine protease
LERVTKMNSCFILLALVVVASAMSDREAFQFFKNKYGKSYNKGAESASRFAVFQSNLRAAEQLQAANPSALYGITKFMDLTPEEFRAQYANLNVTAYARWIASLPRSHKAAPTANPVDWRGKAVSTVKDQGQCGSCWAFATAAALEGCAMLKNGGKAVDVSAQQLVDCCTAGGSDGCNGGYPDKALSWAVARDMATWSSYPYTAEQGSCKAVKTVAVAKNTCAYSSITRSEKQVLAHLENGPVSICLAAGVLQYYTGGIISGDDCSDTAVDHAVFLVAYTGTAYTVKNSWASNWGEQGYFRMAAGVNCLDMDYLSSQALPK